MKDQLPFARISVVSDQVASTALSHPKRGEKSPLIVIVPLLTHELRAVITGGVLRAAPRGRAVVGAACAHFRS